MKKIFLLSILLLVNQCANNRSHTGALLGATTTTAACLQYSDNPIVAATCAVAGAFVGADLMYDSDYDVHNAVFVDHLNTSPKGASYTNWYNSKTGNSGIIHTTRSYLEEQIKCKDYSSTVDITNNWPLIGIGGINRKVVFGTACQLPDGRWVEKGYNEHGKN
jgi:surface antigen